MTMRFDASARVALVVAAVTLVISGLGFRVAVGKLNVYLQKEAVPLRGPLSRIPIALGPWQRFGEDGVISASIRDALGTDQYLDRDYRRDAEAGPSAQAADPIGLSVHLAYYTGMIDTVPHVPERCWGAAGMLMTEETFRLPLAIDDRAWRDTDLVNAATGETYRAVDVIDPISRRTETVHMPIGEFAVRTTEFQLAGDPDRRLIGGYLFIANGRITSSSLGVRRLAFSARERHAYYIKVQFNMPASASDPDRFDRFAERSADLLSRMLPHLMRQLPDWPSVQRAAESSTDQPADPSATTAPRLDIDRS